MADQLEIKRETQIVRAMKRRNRPVRAVLNGTTGILCNVENKTSESEPTIVEYIKREQEESPETYKNRLLRTYVTPYTKTAIETAAGQIFKNPITIKIENDDEFDPRVQDVINDVDLNGSDLNQWLMSSTIESMSYGMSIAYGGFLNPSESENLSEQIASGARPFVKLVSYFDLLGFNFDEQGRVTMLRFMEEAEIEDDFYGSDRIQQVRVVRPTSYEVYREDEKGNQGLFEQGSIVRFDESGQEITDYIPIVTMYGNKLGTLNASSVFEDMAHINIQHTQVNSDLSWSSHFYLIPFLFTMVGEELQGSEKDVQAALSNLSSYINVTLPAGSDIKWVETNGKASEAALKHLAAIEQRIAESKMDATVSVSAGARESATGRAIDADGTSAKLKLHAEAVESFAKGIIDMMASFMPEVTMPKYSVVANKDFSVSLDGQTVKAMSDMVAAGQLSLETMLHELKRRGVLADDIDIAVEIEKINEESAYNGLQ